MSYVKLQKMTWVLALIGGFDLAYLAFSHLRLGNITILSTFQLLLNAFILFMLTLTDTAIVSYLNKKRKQDGKRYGSYLFFGFELCIISLIFSLYPFNKGIDVSLSILLLVNLGIIMVRNIQYKPLTKL